MDPHALASWLERTRATEAAFPSETAIVRAGVTAWWGQDPFPALPLLPWLAAVVNHSRELPPAFPRQPGDLLAFGEALPGHLVVRDPRAGALQITVLRVGNRIGLQAIPEGGTAYRPILQTLPVEEDTQ